MSTFLADAAKRLGADDTIMHSYWEYHERRQNWFFSPNPNLASATRRPSPLPKLETWKKLTSKERLQEWKRYSMKQRMTISTLAGFGPEGRRINLDSTNHYSRLQQGLSKWRHDLYSVFWSDNGKGKLWLCNVFVGDAIYMYNRSSFTSSNDHYYDPEQISLVVRSQNTISYFNFLFPLCCVKVFRRSYGYACKLCLALRKKKSKIFETLFHERTTGKSNLNKRNSYKEVRVGDIVVIDRTHVEIVTQVNYNWFYDHGFCSIGAGRAAHPNHSGGDGTEKCDYFGADEQRELENKNNTFYYL
ncbi:MAG: hypothetical protein MI922_11140 [Bacteroidales bacterium]|nr:hypothetical protein [Bacteroidales bacterium]